MHSDKASGMDRGRRWRGAAGSIAAGAAALLMLGVVTYGATSIRPTTADRQADVAAAPSQAQAAGHDGGVANGDGLDTRHDGPKDGPKDEPGIMDGWEGKDGGYEEPKESPAEEPKDEPTPTEKPAEPTPTEKPAEPKPTEKPADSGLLSLEAWTKAGHVKLAWTKFGGDGFEYYKVVRSPDAAASWPLGDNDELVGVISDRFSPWFADSPPCGHEWHYRVFAVRHSGDGYQVLAESNQAAAYLDCDAPADPTILGFELKQMDGGVKLFWEACTSDSFVAYKVVRSKVNENPTFPLNDGTQLVAAIENHTVTSYKDTDVAAGQTWTYRVYSMAKNGDGWVVLGMTKAISITVG